MNQTDAKIKAVVLHRGSEVATFPVLSDADARAYIADCIAAGFRAGHVGDEVHLFAPPPPPPEPLPKVVTRGLGRVQGREVRGSTVVPTVPAVVPTQQNPVPPAADVVSLAEYKARRRSNRDFLSLDGGAA